MNEAVESRTFTDARGAERTIRIIDMNDGRKLRYLVANGNILASGRPAGDRYKSLEAARAAIDTLHTYYTGDWFGRY